MGFGFGGFFKRIAPMAFGAGLGGLIGGPIGAGIGGAMGGAASTRAGGGSWGQSLLGAGLGGLAGYSLVPQAMSGLGISPAIGAGNIGAGATSPLLTQGGTQAGAQAAPTATGTSISAAPAYGGVMGTANRMATQPALSPGFWSGSTGMGAAAATSPYLNQGMGMRNYQGIPLQQTQPPGEYPGAQLRYPAETRYNQPQFTNMLPSAQETAMAPAVMNQASPTMLPTATSLGVGVPNAPTNLAAQAGGGGWMGGLRSLGSQYGMPLAMMLGSNLMGSMSQADMMEDYQKQVEEANRQYLAMLNPPKSVRETRYRSMVGPMAAEAPHARTQLSNVLASRGVRGQGAASPMAEFQRKMGLARADAYNRAYGTWNVPSSPLYSPVAPEAGQLFASNMGRAGTDLATMMLMQRLAPWMFQGVTA